MLHYTFWDYGIAKNGYLRMTPLKSITQKCFNRLLYSFYVSYLTLPDIQKDFSLLGIFNSAFFYNPRQKSMHLIHSFKANINTHVCARRRRKCEHMNMCESVMSSAGRSGRLWATGSSGSLNSGGGLSALLEPKLSHKASSRLFERNNRPFITRNKTKEEDGQIIANLWNCTGFNVFFRVERRNTPRLWRYGMLFRRVGAYCSWCSALDMKGLSEGPLPYGPF